MAAIGFYGPGHMGEHLIKCMKTDSTEDKFYSYHPRSERMEELKEKYGVEPITLDTISSLDILFLCVKPIHISEVCSKIQPHLSEKTLIVSILAGVPLQYLQEHLSSKVIRIMTTLVIPPKNGLVFIYSQLQSDEYSSLNQFFHFIPVESDDQIDQSTALYGCGPAFISEIFKIYIQLMKTAFPNLNSPEIIRELFLNTLSSPMESSELISMVACRGGATEQALKVIQNSDVPKVLEETVHSAYVRACQLRSSYES